MRADISDRAGLRVRWWLGGRFGEFVLVDRYVQLHLFDLNDKASVRAGDGPAERGLDTTFVTIVRIIDFGGIAAKWRFHKTQNTDQQSRLLIKQKLHGRQVFSYTCKYVCFSAVDLSFLLHTQLFEDCPQAGG